MDGRELDQQSETSGNDRSERISRERFRELIEPCKDVFNHVLRVPDAEDKSGIQCELYYCDGMVDGQMFQMGLIPMLENWKRHTSTFRTGNDHGYGYRQSGDTEEHSEHASHDGDSAESCSRHPSDMFNETEGDEDRLFECLFAGTVILLFSDRESFYEFNIASLPSRNPEESTMELSLKGPRDGFVEKLSVNIALVRMRMRTPNLHVEYFIIGTETRTEIGFLYMSDQAKPELVEEAKRRLRSITIPSLQGAGELEELISDRPKSLFPLVNYVGRPDFVVHSLMKGRVAILVDGTPAALIAPGNMTLLIKSPEDAHLPYYYVTMERLLRFTGLFVAMFLPGFWVALCSFNTDQIPFTLLATVTMSRIGLPISATMEMFLMLGMFELFREAGVRLPRPVGQTVSVVGGLIIGDAAIRAGMTSPTMLVVAAVAAVSTFTLVNQSLAGSVSVIRFYVLILSSIFGMYGYFVSMFSVLLYMCSLESFGQPYMAPLAPIRFKEVAAAIINKPWTSYKKARRS
ncbi:spore germination protein [Paenibacillus sp. PAMC21692]|uniref:spore germination protein n=1 Tax=Paenibacillus sp. PAMC21692 TaxID=2762320 RepID=UPI00164E61F4|nr:spore germination protein [Paenibacillus sp. PAMC21692]QNK59844.1 spore germination protein [Paenibacillus sp. PAMC21692]